VLGVSIVPPSTIFYWIVKSLLADSGYINDTSITGGRVGVYQFGHQTLWSNMKVHCLERQSKAMYFNGASNDFTSYI
jgi:hypothetical protein